MMAQICPVCNHQMRTAVCCICGFDDSKNIETYPSLSLMESRMKSIRANREEYNNKTIDGYTLQGSFNIINYDLTKIVRDCIVNSTDIILSDRGAVSSAIHKAAGASLYKSCQAIGRCEEGNAVYTHAFNLCQQKAKYIIHVVAPRYQNGMQGESTKLYGCYRIALGLALKLKCRNISFPLLSAGYNRFPIAEAMNIAFMAFHDFLQDYPNSISVSLVIKNKDTFNMARNLYHQFYVNSLASKEVMVLDKVDFHALNKLIVWNCRFFSNVNDDFNKNSSRGIISLHKDAVEKNKAALSGLFGKISKRKSNIRERYEEGRVALSAISPSQIFEWISSYCHSDDSILLKDMFDGKLLMILFRLKDSLETVYRQERRHIVQLY